MAQRFKLEGLLNGENGEEQSSEEVIENNQNFPPIKEKSPFNAKHEKPEQHGNFDTSNELVIPTENNAIRFVMSEEEKNNLVETVDQHLERIDDGSWRCKICGKSANKKNARQQMRYHVEGKHLEGLSLPCNLCGKIFRSRNAFLIHKTRYHKTF